MTLSIYEEYPITIDPDPDSVIEGNFVESTLYGAIVFSKLKFLKESSVSLTASSPYAWPSNTLLLQLNIHFDWILTITEENTIIIEFEETLSYELGSDEIKIELIDELKCEFELKSEEAGIKYIFDMIAGETIPEKTQITVRIIKEQIKSINEHLLNNTEKTGELHFYEYKCPSTTYFDKSQKLCETCLGQCAECESNIICTKCNENSSLTTSKECICNLGYSGVICTRNYFHSSIIISSTNKISIIFSEPLSESLKVSDFETFINSDITDVSISSQTSKTLNLALDPNKEIAKGTILTLVFIKENITSDYNSLLLKNNLKGLLYEHKLAKSSDGDANFLDELGIDAQLISFIIFIAASLILSDPVILGNYINTIEYFYCFYYFDLDIHKNLIVFLSQLRAQSQIPNFFHIFFSTSDGKTTSQLYNEIGYHCNLVILNTGWNITILIILILASLICSLLKKYLKILNTKLKSIIELFYYNAFLRFWLIAYFEIGMASIIAIKFSLNHLTEQIVNISISCLFLTSQNVMALLVFSLVYKRYYIRDNEIKTEFLKKYGTLFNEFYERGLSDWLYYSIMILRKISLMVLSTVNAPQNIAICISFIFSFGVIFK